MKRLTIVLVIAAVAVVGLVSCVVWKSGNNERMANLAAALVPVSSAVDGHLNFSDPSSELGGKDLLTITTEHNPKLLEPFGEYFVMVRRDGIASSILVCDIDREHALMEDSGCTGDKFDARLWEQSPPLACNFQLDLKEVCGAN